MLTGTAATVVLATLEIVSGCTAVITAGVCFYDWFHAKVLRK